MEIAGVEFRRIITSNWFTRRPHRYAFLQTLALAVILYAACSAYWSNFAQAHEWMAATPRQVFQLHEWWRPWTTLFAHGDLAHLFANSLLFFGFSYLLHSYFSVWFFPVMGLLMGGLANVVVLLTLGDDVTLVGASGLVHWMGAAWATLHVLLENRQNFRPRFGNALFLMLVLFTPDTYRPNVSYLAHFIGFIFGVGSSYLYWRFNQRVFSAAEVVEYQVVPPWEFGPWDGSDPDDQRSPEFLSG